MKSSLKEIVEKKKKTKEEEKLKSDDRQNESPKKKDRIDAAAGASLISTRTGKLTNSATRCGETFPLGLLFQFGKKI